jgi:crotonobetainyl-CoA:carnitine CoA-transferase CaiB-like acyl-CoA transferase
VLGAYAVVLGLLHRQRTGHAVAAETSLVDAACLEQVLQLYGADEPADAAGMLGWHALHRAYQVRDGWVFLGAGPAVGQRLAEVLGASAADEPGLAAAFARLSVEQATAAAERAGGAAHTLVPMDDLLAPGGIPDRLGLRLEHDSPVFGAVVQPGPVVRLSRTPMRAGDLPAPDGLDRHGRPVHPVHPVPALEDAPR